MAGRKQWATFEKLTAEDLQDFIADQAVMRFADATARTAALGDDTTGLLFDLGVDAIGMMTALASDDGAPSYWDGADWQLVSAGVQVPQATQANDTSTMEVLSASITTTSNVWSQITAGLGANALVFGLTLTDGVVADHLVEIGTGAASSEVVRFASKARAQSAVYHMSIPFGIYVPASTRIAIRCQVGGVAIAPKLFYVPVSSGTQHEAGAASASIATNTTAWQQVAASPPKAGGVEIIGIGWLSSPGTTFRLGFGAAASEVAQTQYVNGDAFSGAGTMPVPPLTWSAGTRLAVQLSSSPNTGAKTLLIFWRESLDVF